MPIWRIARRRTASSGATSANSTAAWPFSEWMCRRPLTWLLEDVRDGVELAADAERERGQRDHDEHGDDGEDDAVLGHRLTVLTLAGSAEQVDPGAKSHAGTPMWRRVCRSGSPRWWRARTTGRTYE